MMKNSFHSERENAKKEIEAIAPDILWPDPQRIEAPPGYFEKLSMHLSERIRFEHADSAGSGENQGPEGKPDVARTTDSRFGITIRFQQLMAQRVAAAILILAVAIAVLWSRRPDRADIASEIDDFTDMEAYLTSHLDEFDFNQLMVQMPEDPVAITPEEAALLLEDYLNTVEADALAPNF